jgi:MFS superfamily sulfate permease-like transporter
MGSVRRRFPGLGDVAPGADILAGLTLWGVLVPEALAYAGMAGMPVQAGLYTLIASLPLYFFLGGSPTLVCAATSSESIMMAAIVAPLAGGDMARHVLLTALLVFVTGSVFLLAGLFRLGRMTAFLSKPVMTGFIFGLAIYIAASQLHKILGLPQGQGDIFMQVMHLAGNLDRCNPVTAAIGACALGMLFFFEKTVPRLPTGLCVMALGIVASRYFDLGPGHGVDTVQAFPAGLPSLALPGFRLADVRALIPAAAGLALVAFSQALGAAEHSAARLGLRVEADRELTALGAANLGSSLLGGILAGGSMSSTAVNVAAGARSKLSAGVAAIMTGLTLCYFVPAFQGLPEAILGAVVMHAVARLMKVSEVRRYYRQNANEFALCLIALGGVVLLDILPGLIAAVAASFARLGLYASAVELSVMGEIRDCGVIWVDSRQHPQAREAPGIRVLRMEGTLFFANAAKFQAAVLGHCTGPEAPKALILQLKANRHLCITSADMLLALARELQAARVLVAFADLAPDVVAMFRKNGMAELVGERNMHLNIERAVADVQARLGAAAPDVPQDPAAAAAIPA